MTKNSQNVIVITGPTATGKTALGVALAKSIGGEIVSADSMQIYKYMNIGTAKPTAMERQGVPHHMLDIVFPWEDYSVARYISDAAICINDILLRGGIPIIVGGTGLYIDSLLSGREFSARADRVLRATLESEYDCIGGELMLQKLSEIDPESARKLHPNDKKRLVRAFEVYQGTGKTISQHNLETKSLPQQFGAMKYALTFSNRATLYRKIDRRVDDMLEMGLPNEVRWLLDCGVLPGSTAMQAIGYKEISEALQDKADMFAAAEQIKMQSRRYAKRQLTWLRRDSDLEWIAWDELFAINDDPSAIGDEQVGAIASHIAQKL